MMTAYSNPPPSDPFSPAREQFSDIEQWLTLDSTTHLEHFELETQLEQRGRELMRRLLQSHFVLRALREERQSGVLGSDGVLRSHVVQSSRLLSTVFGQVNVERLRYGKPGSTSLFPLDADLNLPKEEHSHGLRLLAAEQASRGSYDETVEVLEQHKGVKIGKRQVEELTHRASVDFEAFYNQRVIPPPLPGQASASSSNVLVMTTDGKGIVMRHEDLRPATRKAAEKAQSKLEKRLSKGEKKNRKRMAAVASVYDIAPHIRSPEQVIGSLAPVHDVQPKRPKPINKRVWASVERETVDVIDEMFEEAQRRDPEQQRTWVALVDGNEHQLELVKTIAQERGLDVHIVIDFIHVLEYLWKAVWSFFDEGDSKGEEWVAQRALRILQGKASTVAAGIRRSATRRGIEGSKREKIDKTCNYILKYAGRMHYDVALANGWPIATGVIEGACRYLIKDRMDITGARWSLKGAEAVLKLRAIRTSGDLDEYWRFHLLRERQRTHSTKFASLRVVEQDSSI